MANTWLCMRNDFLQSPLYGSINSPAIEKVPVILGLPMVAKQRFKIINFFQYIDKDLAKEIDGILAQASPVRLANTVAEGWSKNKLSLLSVSEEIAMTALDRLSIEDKLELVLRWSQANEEAFPFHPVSIILSDVLYEVLKAALVRVVPS